MAILANRGKSFNSAEILRNFINILRKILVLFLLLFSFMLVYIPLPQFIRSQITEVRGGFSEFIFLTYDYAISPILSLKTQIEEFSNLYNENHQLKLEISKLQKQILEIEALRYENNSLRKILHVINNLNYNYLTVKILSISANPFIKTAMINAGADQNIKVGMIALGKVGIIGLVSQVSKHYSEITLINDMNIRIPVIAENSREKVIFAGNNKGGELLYLQQKHQLISKEKLITSGDGTLYPYGLPVAEIIINSNDELEVKQIENIDNTDYVTLIDYN